MRPASGELGRSAGTKAQARALRLILDPLLRRAARRVLVGRSRCRRDVRLGRFTRADIDHLMADTWRAFAERAPGFPQEPTVGSRMNVRLAGLTVSFLEALTAAGVERGYAIELVGDVAWSIYRKWGLVPCALSRAAGRDPVARMRFDVNAFLRFPFNPPGYAFADVPEARGRAFTILRCPVAEYMGREDASDLCTATWCNLDYALAELWGGRLERSGTLAGGAPACDFRFTAGPDRPRAGR